MLKRLATPKKPTTSEASHSSPASLLCCTGAWTLGVELTPSPLDFFRQGSLLGQRGSVFCGEHFIGETFECVLCHCVIPFGAKYQTDWRVLTGERPMLTCIIQI
jgi:hypothetical protein